MELGPHGITVNAVAPGFVRTGMTQGGRGAADWQGTEERLAARAMMGRIGEPEDIANAVALGVGLVLDCTGRATKRSGAQAHLENLSDPKGSRSLTKGASACSAH
jgi:NAD(P)-dependent dehydrogenase (short-subunit alcohol dehydrogenase family)